MLIVPMMTPLKTGEIMGETKRAAIYLRVSTDKQTVENQRIALAAVAERRGWQIVGTFSDKGISGAKSREDRPGLDDLLKRAQRREFRRCDGLGDRPHRPIPDRLIEHDRDPEGLRGVSNRST